MKFCTSVGVLLVLLVGCVLSQQDSCKVKEYGNCDPGPNCTYWRNNLCAHPDYCFNCCDDRGYITKNKLCDGVVDCKTGSDEDPELCSNFPCQNLRSGKLSCFAPKHNCSEDNDCCSKVCKDGICWDERCG